MGARARSLYARSMGDALVSWISRMHSVGLFVSACAGLRTLYGGAFATMPVYRMELCGTAHAGVLCGRLLTAHAAAAVAGPVLVNDLRECQVAKGVPPTAAYSSTMSLMACGLIVGFLGNGAVQPIHHPRARHMARVVRSQQEPSRASNTEERAVYECVEVA